MKCDVLIVGAGIAGLYLARELSKKKIKTTIIDRSEIPGEPNFSTAGMLTSTRERFALPVDGVAGIIDKIGFGTKSSERIWKTSKTSACVLDFRKTKQLLAQEASRYGTKVLWGVKAQTVKKNDEICIIETSVGEIECICAVDAAGSSRILFKSEKTKRESPCVGVEVIVSDETNILLKYKNTMFFYFDFGLSPYGYAWVFYNGNGTYKIGVAETNIDVGRQLTALGKRLESFTSFLTGGKKIPIIEEHGESIVVSPNTHIYHQGKIVAIGDAAGMTNPFLGEGIRHSLFSAQFALKSIVDYLHGNGSLDSYSPKIQKYKNANWRMMYFVKKALYAQNTPSTQKLYEQFVDYGKYMDMEDVIELTHNYSFAPLLKGFPHIIPLTLSFLKLIL